MICRLWGVMRIGSGKRPEVKAKECRNPFVAFVTYFPDLIAARDSRCTWPRRDGWT